MTRAEHRRALREGQEVDVAELAGVNPAPRKPYRALLLGWTRHGTMKLYPVELHGENEVFKRKIVAALDLIERMTGVSDPSPYEIGLFHGMHGGPLNPMDVALAAIAGWAEANGWRNLGEEQVGEEPIFRLATILRDILGGQFVGSRSRGGEDLPGEALEPMRQLPKTKRF